MLLCSMVSVPAIRSARPGFESRAGGGLSKVRPEGGVADHSVNTVQIKQQNN